jgi:carbamoyl-phosphate synthase/aspartate carbamoyltransferase/dihydroorotase
MVEEMIQLAIKYDRRLHICHVSQAIEVNAIKNAKRKFSKLSAGVTPHHLYLTEKDRTTLGNNARMKPELGMQKDQDALWEGLRDGTLDLVESDHAPHTIDEKKNEPPPFGVPGLETTLGLLWKAVHDKKIQSQDIRRWLYDNPKKLFSIPDQPQTFVELDPDRPFTIGENGYETKCGWSPFDGWEAYGQVQTVVYRGKKIISAGKFTI